MSTITSRTGGAALLAALLLAACGGGGGGEAPPAAPPPITVAGGGTVASSDGRARLEVAPGAASAQADSATLVKVTPEPAMAADPAYVLDTAYQWEGPDLSFSTDALWEVQAPATVQAALPDRKQRLGATNYTTLSINPAQVCNPDYAALGNNPPSTITVFGSACPAGCSKIGGQTYSDPAIGAFHQSICAPTLGGVLVTPPAGCPAQQLDATNEEPYKSIVDELNAELGTQYRICKPVAFTAAPFAVQGALNANSRRHPCVLVRGTLRCNLPSMARGVIATYSDTTPPTQVAIGHPSPLPAFIDVDNSGSHAVHTVQIPPSGMQTVPLIAAADGSLEPIGLSQIELREVVVGPGSNLGGGTFSSAVRWSAVPAGQSLPAGTKIWNSVAAGATISFDFRSTDAPSRWFFMRAYDWVGNARDGRIIRFKRVAAPAPVITAFTASPSQIAPPGGSTTLAWSIAGASSASIDQGIGAVNAASGSVAVNVAANTTFTLTATSALGAVSTLPLAVTIGADTAAPTVSLASSATAVTAPASATLTATATDAVGVARVDFYRGSTLIASDSAAADGFQHVVAFTPADAGTPSFTARAFDAVGNHSTSAAVTITVSTDTQPPSITLAGSASTVLAPGSVMLTANASDNVGVARVDFYRGNTLIGSDSSAGDGFTQAVNFSTADAGAVAFRAIAFDAMNNQAPSATVIVTVTLPASGDTYASPTGNDSSSTCSQAAPCRTIGKAALTAGAGATTWLLDGSYTTATQGFSGATLPAGTTLRAANAGVPIVKVPLLPAGNATIGGLRFGSGGGLQAASGSIALEGVDFVETLNLPLQLSGSAAVTMTPGAIADYIAGTTDVATGVGPLAQLSGGASLTINGGAFGLGTRGIGSTGQAAFQHNGTGTLTLNGVPVNTHHHGVAVSAAGSVVLNASPVQRVGVPTMAMWGLIFSGSGGSATITNSTISGFGYGGNSAALAVSGSASITTTGAAFAHSSQGVRVTGSATLNLASTQIHDNLFAGVACTGACSLAMSGGAVRDNARFNASTGWSYQGGLHFGGGVTHSVSLRNVSVIDNRNTVVDGATNQANNAGITLIGNAGSVFDLGTAASPGGNTFTGNTTGNLTAGVHVNTAVGVTVNAVGNTFIANTQGAGSTGLYQLGASPCGTGSCVVGSGAGSNYRITSGALRLAQ